MARRARRFATEYETLPAAHRRTGIGLKCLRKATADGEIPLYQVNGWARVKRADVNSWIEDKRVRPRDPAHAARVVESAVARFAERGL